jgi:hypothetical protein
MNFGYSPVDGFLQFSQTGQSLPLMFIVFIVSSSRLPGNLNRVQIGGCLFGNVIVNICHVLHSGSFSRIAAVF